MKIKTTSAKETETIAEKFVFGLKSLAANKKAVVVALEGELGAGKTTFVKGLFRALGVKGTAVSPTFIIVRKKEANGRFIKKIFHMDAYRIKEVKELENIGFSEMINAEGSMVIVEWAGNIKKAIPVGAFWIKFSHGKKENERTIEIKK